MEYRKACLQLVNELLRENIEQRFLCTSSLASKSIDDEKFEGWSKSKIKAYKDFMKAKTTKISKEVFNEKIEAAMEHIMTDLASISSMFTDDEMHQIYELTKSPLGLKIIRNLDIMRQAVREGLALMGNELSRKWTSSENASDIEVFMSELNNMR